jgi:anaerobic selenocysteine-containing dehydrogenase
LKESGAAVAITFLATRLPFSYDLLTQPLLVSSVETAPVSEKWISTGCTGCVGWCPLQVKVVGERAVKIRGNPYDDKVNGGKLCVRGHANLQILYDPDRLKAPVKRTNPRKGRDEDPGWVQISWDEALEAVASRLKPLRERGTPERLLILRGRYNKLDSDMLYDRFSKAYGTPNKISHSAICAEPTKIGNWMAQGRYAYSSYDVERARYIISFGAPLLESHRPTASTVRRWPEARVRGLRMAVVDPRFSVTAAKADEWLPIKSGTDGALACAIAHEILVQGLWDRVFVGDFTDGVNRFKPGQSVSEGDWKDAYTTGLTKWWNIFLKDFGPDQASTITDIPSATIRRVAHEFARTKPATAWRARGSTDWPASGAYNSYAIASLNALAGSVEVSGGMNHYPSVAFKSWPAVVEDEIAKTGGKKAKIDGSGTRRFPRADVITNNVADNILSDNPYPIEAIIAYWNNFTFSAPGSKRWEEALKKVPFSVHLSTRISEWGWYSDLVLPVPTWLEKWDCMTPAGGATQYTRATLYQPAIKPLYNTMSEAQFAIALARRLGGTVGESFLGFGGEYGDSDEGLVKYATEPLWKPMTGGWEEFREKGVWISPEYKPKWEFPTPSKKWEFYSASLAKLFADKKIGDEDLAAMKVKARGDLLLVPHYEEPVFIGEQAEYPLVLVTYKNSLNMEGRSKNVPWVQEIYLPLHGIVGENVAEVHPQTAARHGIADGDMIWVESKIGRIRIRAKVFQGVRPDVVAMAYGQGHWKYGRWADNRGANPNEIMGVEYEYYSGGAAFHNTRVKIYGA